MRHFTLKPSQIFSALRWIMPFTYAGWISFGGIGLYFALWASPADYQQGEMVRMMYVHVPSAWLSLALFTAMAITSALGLITRVTTFHILCKSIAPVGCAMTALSLITGAIWGKPTWGTWWVWDARLTTMLLQFFLYLGYILCHKSFQEEEKGLSAAAFICIIGWINVPLIKWSVEWWSTLHQPASIMRLAKPAIHWQMLVPLGFMALAFTCYCIAVIGHNLRKELYRRQWLRRQLQQVAKSPLG